MKQLARILIICWGLDASSLWALQIGTGIWSITAGRHHPIAYLGSSVGSWSASFASLGFRHQYGDTTAYAGTCLYDFPLVGFTAGLGLGASYVTVGHQGADGKINHSGTWALGPAIKVLYYPTNFWWLGMQGIFGLGLATIAGLATQDQVMALTGVDF